MNGWRARLLALVTALGVLAAPGAAAQVPDSTRPRPLPADTARAPADTARTAADTLRRADAAAVRDSVARADSATVDSLRGTDRFLRLQDRIKVRLAVAPPLNADGPRPAGSRLVFTADSLRWVNGESVADLLGQVEGAYVWRGGWQGRAAYANFRGRGAASTEYLLDGVPYVAAGFDSVAVDGGRLPLSLFERVEIERLPGLLRVHLFTPRQARLAAASRLQIGTGTGGLTRFAAALEQRSRRGFGVSLLADYLNTASATSNAQAFRNTHLLGVLQYVPTPRAGVEVLLTRNAPVRRPFLAVTTAGTAALDSGLADRRSDLRARAFWRARADGFGAGLDVIASRTSVGDTLSDTLAVPQFRQRIDAAGAVLGLRGPTAFLTAEGWVRSRWTTAEGRVRSGASVGSALTLSADGVYQRHDGDRTSRWVAGRASLRLPVGLTLGAGARAGRIVGAPSLLADTAQSITELEGTAAFESGPIGLHGAITRVSAFRPPGFAVFPQVPRIGLVDEVTWVSGGGRLRPFSWLTLESWGSTPLRGTAIGQPPRHAVSSGTIRTKFLRAFPSGVLDLRLQAGVEYWDAFVIGVDAGGGAVTLPTTTHVFVQAQLQLQAFEIYFQQRNTANRLVQYVPGYTIPGYANSFGIRWRFTN